MSGVVLIQNVGWRAIYWIAFLPIIVVALAYAVLPESMIIYLRKGNTGKIREILKKANPEFKPSEEDVYEVSAVNKTKATLVHSPVNSGSETAAKPTG
ncbi:MAG: hypothetical protein GX434_01400 [Peptococcaceae bacterium]|nr:hypothetical protein [Peptococcaceae bacterium]